MKFTITKTIPAQQKLSRKLAAGKKNIAVVPTMGYLHEGHLSLIKRGLKTADVVVTTIFVNPAQFAPGEDFDKYPRDTKGDLEKIKQAGGQVAFVPKMADMYPDDFKTHVTVEKLTKKLEGEARPTHFEGVTTIVAKLFNIVRPDIALFGMKDFQQAVVLKQMVRDLNWPIKMVICPTVREKDGLAMSSRNSYLSPEQRMQATALYQALKGARNLCDNGETRISEILRYMRQTLHDVSPSAKIDYIAFTDMETLSPRARIEEDTVASMAVRFDKIRLIDNMQLA
jgi:pantoate--beta-alanine ligase